MDSLLTDIRYAARRIKSAPAFSLVAIVTLGLAIAATTAIYSVVDALMFRPLPYRDAHQLVDVAVTGADGVARGNVTVPQFRGWEQQAGLFAAIEAYANRGLALTGGGEPVNLGGAAFSGGFMEMLGVPPQLGRILTSDDTQPGREQVVVISDRLWKTRFGADPKVLGRTVRLADKSYEIVGVMPGSFSFPWGRRDVWVPLPAATTAGSLNLTARLRPDATREQTQVQLDSMTSALAEAGAIPANRRAVLNLPIARHINPGIRRGLAVLAGAVMLVLLIACANLANLLLVQGTAREREIAVRTALGASRGRTIRQLLTETALLAIAGGALGILIAQWAIDLLAAFTPPDMTFLETSAIRLDARVVLFAIALTAITGAAFGLLPALRGSRTAPHDTLKDGARSATGGPRQEHLRRAFVLMQLALTVMLLVGAGLLTRTFLHMTRLNPGFDPRNLVTAQLVLPGWKYKTPELREQFHTTLVDRLRATPGVIGATVTGGTPPSGGGFSFGMKFDIRGRGIVLDDPTLTMPTSDVDAAYFETMRIPLKAGRTFTRDDSAPGAAPVIVIGESLARRLWPGENPINQQLRWFSRGPYYTVVGVVGDVYQFEYDQPRGQLAAYHPAALGGSGQTMLVVRTTLAAETMARTLREAIWSVDPDQPIMAIETIETAYEEFFARPRFYAFLMSVFAVLGLVIAGVGLYGVVAYATAQRTREFGIRMALGAQRSDVLRLVLRTGFLLAIGGIVLGAAGSLLVTRGLASMLVEIQRTDAMTYAAVLAASGAIAVIACWIPARRATRVDPVVALRYE